MNDTASCVGGTPYPNLKVAELAWRRERKGEEKREKKKRRRNKGGEKKILHRESKLYIVDRPRLLIARTYYTDIYHKS